MVDRQSATILIHHQERWLPLTTLKEIVTGDEGMQAEELKPEDSKDPAFWSAFLRFKDGEKGTLHD